MLVRFASAMTAKCCSKGSPVARFRSTKRRRLLVHDRGQHLRLQFRRIAFAALCKFNHTFSNQFAALALLLRKSKFVKKTLLVSVDLQTASQLNAFSCLRT
jgi:hypothetical protein